MRKIKKEKGITLIALIITIVVMVILAGIIIVSAVADGGVIDRAQTALIEQERAEAQDIIETSYVYKTTASQTTYGYLDMPKTAEAIFNNLTNAGFKLKLSDGTEAAKWEEIYSGGDTIELNIKGNRSEYKGTVDSTGLKNGLKIKEEEKDNDNNDNNNNNNDNENNSYIDVEISQTDCVTGCEMLTITPKLNLTEDMFTEEEAFQIYADYMNEDWGTNFQIETTKDLLMLMWFGDEMESHTYEELVQSVIDEFEIENTNLTEQEILEIFLDGSIKSAAVDIYLDKFDDAQKTFKINGKEIVDGITWNGATCYVSENGTYDVELDVEGYKTQKQISVTRIGKENSGNWTDNGDGTYTRGNITIEIGVTKITNSEMKAKFGEENLKYAGTWSVIAVEGEKVKLATTENVANDIYLGWSDPGAIAAIPAVDESAPTDEEKIERSIWSIINVESTLNKAAEEKTGIEGAKSITLEDVKKLMGVVDLNRAPANGKVYKYYYDETTSEIYSKYKTGENTWSEGVSTGTSSQKFINNEGAIVVVDSKEDEITLINNMYNHSFTTEQNSKLTDCFTNGVSCWIPNIWVYGEKDCVRYNCHVMNNTSLSVSLTSLYRTDEGNLQGIASMSLGVKATIYV